MNTEDMEEQLENASELEQILWKAIEKSIGSEVDIITSSAVLIRIALSLYTIILPKDEDVEKMSNAGLKTIPNLREVMRRELSGIIDSNTIH